MGRVSRSSDDRRRILHYTPVGKLWLSMEKHRGSFESGLIQWSFRHQEHFGVTLGVNIEVDAVRAVCLGDDDVHKWNGAFRSAHAKTPLKRNAADDLLRPFCRSRPA